MEQKISTDLELGKNPNEAPIAPYSSRAHASSGTAQLFQIRTIRVYLWQGVNFGSVLISGENLLVLIRENPRKSAVKKITARPNKSRPPAADGLMPEAPCGCGAGQILPVPALCQSKHGQDA